MIVAQHSFGMPCDIKQIVDLAKENSIFLLEDCAISFDSKVGGVAVGNFGDAAIYSTDHTKPLNTIIGGVLYTRTSELHCKVRDFAAKLPTLDSDHQNRIFSQMCYERDNYQPQRYARSILSQKRQSLIRKLTMTKRKRAYLESDYEDPQTVKSSPYPYPARMPAFLARLGLFELQCWKKERIRRKFFLSEYLRLSKELNITNLLPKSYFDSNLDIVPLRFVFRSSQIEKARKKLNKCLDVSQMWFQSPIICTQRGPETLGYSWGSCPNAEKSAKSIINWPCVLSGGWEKKIFQDFEETHQEEVSK